MWSVRFPGAHDFCSAPILGSNVTAPISYPLLDPLQKTALLTKWKFNACKTNLKLNIPSPVFLDLELANRGNILGFCWTFFEAVTKNRTEGLISRCQHKIITVFCRADHRVEQRLCSCGFQLSAPIRSGAIDLGFFSAPIRFRIRSHPILITAPIFFFILPISG